MGTLYTILGLTETATDEQIKQAYRALAKQYHPDLHPGDAACARKFAQINEAMEQIGDPVKRKEYDNKRKAEEKRAEAAKAAGGAAANASAAVRAAAAAAVRAAQAAQNRPYMGTAAGAQQVIQDSYRKGYNEGFAAGQTAGQNAAQSARNAAAETWKKSADSWKKEAEKYRDDVDILKSALDKARQRAADAESSAHRMEISLKVQTEATEEAKRGIAAEQASKESMRELLEGKINVEREARRYSDEDKVRLSREVMRLKQENEQLKEKLSKYEKYDGPEQSAEESAYIDNLAARTLDINPDKNT